MTRYNKILKNSLFKKALTDIVKKEERRIFCKHGIEHLLDVARIAYILSLENNIDISKDIIYATALLHDIGRAIDDKEHCIKSIELADKILSDCDYNTFETAEIKNAILNHKKDVSSLKNLSDIICKADKLSRQCYNCKAQAECYWQQERRNKNIVY